MMNLNKEICKAFNIHANEYEQVAKVQREIGERLFERLDYLKIQPLKVLDLGCGPGFFTKRLKNRYRQAHVIGVDFAQQMLKETKAKQSWRQTFSLVNADMTSLPFQDGQFDLIFSNQVVHWSPSLSRVFGEINRVMRPGGCLMFSTLGPDTFLELRQAFSRVDNFAHVNEFWDMHDVGDCLLKEYFLDPVMDMNRLMALYPSLKALLQTLKSQGVRNINQKRNSGLTGKSAWQAFEQEMLTFCTPEKKFPLTYEVIYGHAWKGAQRRLEQGTEAYFPLDQLKVKRD